MNILFLSYWYPYPANNGSRIRIYNDLRALGRRHEVTLLSFAETSAPDDSAIAALSDCCSSVRVIPMPTSRPGLARSLSGFLADRPRHLVEGYSPHMRAAVGEEYARNNCDVIVAAEMGMMPYPLSLPGVPAVLDEMQVSIITDYQKGSAFGQVRRRLTAAKMGNFLKRTLPRFAACIVASELERAKVQRLAPGYRGLRVIPNAVDVAEYKPGEAAARANSLVLPGALTWHANYDAAAYFLREIYPAVRLAQPDATVQITGAHDGVDLAALPSLPGVDYTGHVADIRALIADTWATLVPLRSGGGTRLKILESMALGTPVVSTSKGAEGLDVTHGKNILLADNADQFAARVVELLRSPELRARLAGAGRRLVESKYDSRRAGDQLCEIVEQAAAA